MTNKSIVYDPDDIANDPDGMMPWAAGFGPG